MRSDLGEIQAVAERWSPEQVLGWAFAEYGDSLAIATGFGVEGMVLLDIAWKINPDLKVFTGDTEFLFPETYDLMDRVEEKYGIKVERIFSQLTPEEQERKFGSELWAHDPDQCCNLRKIEPLRRKLATLDAWVTAIRRSQTAQRAGVRKVDWDAKFNLMKISPIANWTREMVWKYALRHEVPYNPLHDRSYPSIGCTHCTRPVKPGEHARAGRWAGSQKKECGLHTPQDSGTTLVQLAAVAADE